MYNSDHDEPHSSDDQPSLPFLTRFIATGFFSGYIPWASGTFGSIVGALFFFIPGFSNPVILLLAIVAGLAAGMYTSAQVADVEGDRLTKSAQKTKDRFQPERHDTPDPSIVVIDEIVGMWIAMFALPTFVHHPLTTIVVAFLSFRFFDIIKPYPAKQVERYKSGWGIMLDDVIAGIYANIITRILVELLIYVFPDLF